LGFGFCYLNARRTLSKSEKIGLRSEANRFKPKELQSQVTKQDRRPRLAGSGIGGTLRILSAALMAEAVPTSRVVKFGVFEVDLDKGEVHKSGLKLRLRGQPFQVLTIALHSLTAAA
jgi:DNA-binding response OmpR family regulator